MSVTVEREEEANVWNRFVEQSPETNPLHQYEALKVLSAHTNARLHPLVVYKGQEPIGLFPLFETKSGPFTHLTSPPPPIHTLQLGPATLNLETMKCRKAEQRRRAFLEQCLTWADEVIDPDHVLIRTDPRFTDIRPLTWNGFEVNPYYTYFVDLTRSETDLLAAFTRDARSNITNTDADAYEIKVGHKRDFQQIISQVERRLDAQNASLGIPSAIITDLYDSLPTGTLRPYICRSDGEYVSGIITLESDTRIYRWQGGVKADADIPASELLDWYVIRAGIRQGRTYYDLVGANDARLCRYKSKFAPARKVYFTAAKRTKTMNAMRALRGIARQLR
ncbi:lipid II:glycine glycyltransferase FemX [Natrialbaceae archaeon GCM10025810]|uniref:lipid II:glycine glycyltransferase FemX n=1 Tax=Halovalidus salilacus TaxID=3075124 RepID=UPI003620ABCC